MWHFPKHFLLCGPRLQVHRWHSLWWWWSCCRLFTARIPSAADSAPAGGEAQTRWAPPKWFPFQSFQRRRRGRREEVRGVEEGGLYLGVGPPCEATLTKCQKQFARLRPEEGWYDRFVILSPLKLAQECRNNLRTLGAICTRRVAIWAIIPVRLIEKLDLCEYAHVCPCLIPARLYVCEAGGDRRRTGGQRGNANTPPEPHFQWLPRCFCFLPLTCFAPPVLPVGEAGALSLDCRAATRAFLPAGRGISTGPLFALSSPPVPSSKVLSDCFPSSWIVRCCRLKSSRSWIFSNLPLGSSS